MLVQGGNNFLNKQELGKTAKSSKREKSSFEEMLTKSNEQKPRRKKVAPKKLAKSPKAKTRQDDVDENQQKQLRKEPVRKQANKSDIRPISVDPKGQRAQQTVRTNVVKAEGQEKLNQQILSQEVSLANKKFDLNQSQGMQQDASNIQSELAEQSLAKNAMAKQNLDQKFDEFQQQMNEMKLSQMQKQNGNQGVKAQMMAGAKPFMANNQNGKTKLNDQFKLENKLQTLDVDGSQSLTKEVSLDAKASSTSDEASTQLENLVSQFLDSDPGSQSVEGGGNFAEELAIGQKQEGSEKVENMNSIVKQAKAFVKDGGGEMQIHLQPEGLGKVHLKVAVNDGQVNVEMMADNMAAKKALEEGLVDVKQALEGQKLLVETLKVEMSQDYQKDFSDLANHMNEQANRDFAEQFLGQFRQEREERLGGMFDSFRNFQRGPQTPDLSLTGRNPYYESGKGRTVNLVA